MKRPFRSWSELFARLETRDGLEVQSPFVECKQNALEQGLLVRPKVCVDHQGLVEVSPPDFIQGRTLEFLLKEERVPCVVRAAGLEFRRESVWSDWVVDVPDALQCLPRKYVGQIRFGNPWDELEDLLNEIVSEHAAYASGVNYRCFFTVSEDVEYIKTQLQDMSYERFYSYKSRFWCWRTGMPNLGDAISKLRSITRALDFAAQIVKAAKWFRGDSSGIRSMFSRTEVH